MKRTTAAVAAVAVAVIILIGVFVGTDRQRTYPNSMPDGPFKTDASLTDALAAHGIQLPSDASGTRYLAVTHLEDEYPLVLYFTGSCTAAHAAVQKMGIPRVADEWAMPDSDLDSFAVTFGWNSAESDEWYSRRADHKRDEVLIVHEGGAVCKTYIASFIPIQS